MTSNTRPGLRRRELVQTWGAAYLSGMAILRPTIFLFGLLFAGIASSAGSAWAQSALARFEKSTLTIETASGQSHRFEVELALTPRQHAQGLMHRRDLEADAGMLFIYRRDRQVSMWMKNTLIPLDMLFLARDGRIVKVAERTVPMSLRTISSDGSVAAVLELNGGTADRLGISAGDRVLHPDLNGGG